MTFDYLKTLAVKTITHEAGWMNPVLYALVPYAAAVLAVALSIFRRPGGALRCYSQHVAAGVVFAAVALELIPDLLKARQIVATAVGFAFGVIVLLAIRFVSEQSDTGRQKLSKSYIAAIAIDLLIDGFVLSIGFRAGTKQGTLLTIALGAEMIALGLALGSELLEAGQPPIKVVIFTASVSASLILGAGAGTVVLSMLPTDVFVGVLGFGTAALLYLLTEELLREAHEQPETPGATAAFFVGFL